MRHALSMLAATSFLVLPACCLAAEPAKARADIPDVALAGGGLLSGQVVDAQGAPLKATPVSVWFENQQVASAVSDDQGRFTISGLRGGVHQVTAGQAGSVYRLWTAGAAPPKAQSGAIVVPGQAIVRGQNGQPIPSIIKSPILWGVLGYTAGHIIGFNSGIDRTASSP